MTDRLLHDLALMMPETVLTVTILVALIADLIFRRSTVIVSTIVLIGLTVAGILVLGQPHESVAIFSGMLAVDPFAGFFKLLILLSAILVVVFSLGFTELNAGGRKVGEYYTLLVALTLGMMLMAGANNLLMMYLAIELSSISSYTLSGYTRETPDSSEASLKYVILRGTLLRPDAVRHLDDLRDDRTVHASPRSMLPCPRSSNREPRHRWHWCSQDC